MIERLGGPDTPTAPTDRSPSRTWALVAAVTASVAATAVTWMWALVAWAFDPCGGGGIAARCEDPGGSSPGIVLVWATGSTAIAWVATSWVARHRRLEATSVAALYVVGITVPLLGAAVGMAAIAAIVDA
jgi:hypothetical protein